MERLRLRKPRLTRKSIGLTKFWFGIGAGLFVAVALNSFFSVGMELMRLVTSIWSDLWDLDELERPFYQYFFASVSYLLGLNIALSIWFGRIRGNFRGHRPALRTGWLMNQLSLWVVILVVFRYCSLVPILVFAMPDVNNQLRLIDSYPFLFGLIPMVFFLQSWHIYQKCFRAGRWMLASLLLGMLIIFLLGRFLVVGPEVVNREYAGWYKEEFEYIAAQTSRAKFLYGIEYTRETISDLKKFYSIRSAIQMHGVSQAFEQDHPVSLDTIILARMIIDLQKEMPWEFKWEYAGKPTFWYYPLPHETYRQLKVYPGNSPESRELMELLLAMYSIRENTLKYYDIMYGKGPEPDADGNREFPRFLSNGFYPEQLLYLDLLGWDLENVRDSMKLREEFIEIRALYPQWDSLNISPARDLQLR
ncbi:hypothetical protein OZ410_01790 [Robiginitalea sp. M366]|uniref:hypothetical protein n=1 Tax=Robiginitalea aestuariiviva TaxID=3036903 RepID=UPI00240E8F7E|nr:hypothetical protein [Robiginitalea aestuariiviva]MDG1571032.1 hypothetical protein [Robiginitalea aestuariiviva]